MKILFKHFSGKNFSLPSAFTGLAGFKVANFRQPSSAKKRQWSVTVPAPRYQDNAISASPERGSFSAVSLSSVSATLDEPDIRLPALSLELAF